MSHDMSYYQINCNSTARAHILFYRDMYSMEEIEAALQSALQLLGFKALKEHQKQVITKFVLGSDVFVNLPTGSGKSLCYWMLPEDDCLLLHLPSCEKCSSVEVASS